MKKNSAAIAIVLDRSTSMESCRDATILGFNSTLAEQRTQPGECSVMLTTFADDVRVVFSSLPIALVRNITRETYAPNGNTALLDGIGHTIEALGTQLAFLPEHERPERVLVVIMTDGQENRSRKFKKAKITEMIGHQRSKYGWEFAYLGADLTSIEDAVSMGIMRGMAAQYDSSPMGTSQAHRGMSKGISNYRSGGKY